MMPAIIVEQLRKTFNVQKNREGLAGAMKDLFKREYTQVTAVKDIDFTIPRGEICGYIGENGAGKSTTIKMLTGILVPTSGTVRVNGYVPYEEREKFVREIGVVFGQRSQLWWDIGVIESFRLLRKVYRVPESDFRARLDELVERLQLGELLNRPVRKLSLGQRMRCELVASLLHNPSILFLDEPTIGLDIVVKTEIRDFLMQLNREHGTTILLTTHDLQDIEALCSRVIMLDDGRIIYDGGLDELKARWSRGREIRLQFGALPSAEALERLTSGLPGIVWTMNEDLSASMWVPLEVNLSDALSRVVGGAAEIRDIKILETNTDEIVREIYRSGSAVSPERLEELAGEHGAPGTSATGTDGGTDGSGGTEGTGGSEGPGGAEGSGGTEGPGGNAGTDGSDGTDGSGGTGGTEGSGGTGGTGGSDGSGGAEGSDGTGGQTGKEPVSHA